MNESIIIADSAVLHTLIQTLSRKGIIDALEIYQAAMDLVDDLIDQENDGAQKGMLVQAGYHLLKTYIENEPDDPG